MRVSTLVRSSGIPKAGFHQPDIVLLATEWQPRALIRAQLIEDGLEVISTNTWALMRRHLRPGIRPRLALVDLQGLPASDRVLRDLGVLMAPERVLVLTALATTPPKNIERMGFHVLARPMSIEQIVRAGAGTMRSSEQERNSSTKGG